MRDFRFHDLRHSAASYAAMSGASLMELRDLLGHKTLSMVTRYAHLAPEHVRTVAERMAEQFLGDATLAGEGEVMAPRRYPSGEGFVERPDGTRDDAAFHDEFLDNPEAKRLVAEQAIERAIANGMDPARARRLYGLATVPPTVDW